MKTAFGLMLREAKRFAPLGDETYRTAVLKALPLSRTVMIDPDQALAATTAISELADAYEVAEIVRPPFDATLIDFGTGVGHGGYLCLGALFCHVGIDQTNELLALVAVSGGYRWLYSSAEIFNSLSYDPTETLRELEGRRQQCAEIEAIENPIEPERELAVTLGRLCTTLEEVIEKRGVVRDHKAEINRDPQFVKMLAAPFASLAMLESANVELVDSPVQYHRGHVAHGTPKYDVYIRQAKRRLGQQTLGEARYSHRFEVRGNFAHHFEETAAGTPNRLFERWSLERPEKVIQIGGQPCIRIWRPPYVKGPEDMPLIPKIRHIASVPS